MKVIPHPPPVAPLVARAGTPLKETLPTSVEEIYEDNFDFVWRNARRLGVPASSADDVVQDVFIVVQRRLRDFRGGSVRAWILGILVRVVSDHRRAHRRKTGRWVPLEAEKMVDPRNPDELAERAERAQLLERLLHQLDENKRVLPVLADLEHWTLQEIADYFGSNINTIYSRLRAARRDFERAYLRAVGKPGDKP